jgi:hypothetical protein
MSLFTDRPVAVQGPSSFVASILVHGVLSGALSFAFIHAPQVIDPDLNKRFAVRHLELHAMNPVQPPSGGDAGKRAGAKPRAFPVQADDPPEERPSPSWQTLQFDAALQTLVQPDLPRKLKLPKETPIPTVVIWTPKKTDAKSIAPPMPHDAASANVQPSLDAPNEETDLGDLSIASSDLPVPLPILFASSTSPVKIEGPEPLQMAPATASDPSPQPTSAAAMSLSDLRMPQGTVTLPPVNETAPNPLPTTPEPGLSANPSQTGTESSDSKGESATEEKEVNKAVLAVNSKSSAALSEAASGVVAGAGSGNQPAADHIVLPKNGQFGVVVVGSSLEEEYPNLLQIWGGRVAYTVYLHVGRSKNWILQYSLPRSANTAAEGNVGALEAPWPYDIVAPHLYPVLLNADATVLHGIVNSAGRFESLVIVYPSRTPQGTLILNSLAEWKIRPAMRDGKATPVEIVLVIPNEPDQNTIEK